MTQVDFHILPHADEHSSWFYCCRLIAKVVRQGLSVVIALESKEQCQRFSDFLWHFKEDAFFPNAIEFASNERIQLVVFDQNYEQLHEFHQVNVLLCSAVPIWFAQFERVINVVNQQPQQLTLSRQHYRFFLERGYDIQRFDLR
jgi:DNA polymerase III subunit chi